MLPLFLSQPVDMTFGEERQALSSDGNSPNGFVGCKASAMPRLSDRLDGELRERTTYWRMPSEA